MYILISYREQILVGKWEMLTQFQIQMEAFIDYKASNQSLLCAHSAALVTPTDTLEDSVKHAHFHLLLLSSRTDPTPIVTTI